MIFDKYINITQKQVVWDKDDVIIANGAMTENDQFFLETEVGFNIEIKESDYDHQFEAVHKLLNMASLESFIKTSEPIRISTKCIGRNDDVIPNIKMDVYAHSVTYSSTTSNLHLCYVRLREKGEYDEVLGIVNDDTKEYAFMGSLDAHGYIATHLTDFYDLSDGSTFTESDDFWETDVVSYATPDWEPSSDTLIFMLRQFSLYMECTNEPSSYFDDGSPLKKMWAKYSNFN